MQFRPEIDPYTNCNHDYLSICLLLFIYLCAFFQLTIIAFVMMVFLRTKMQCDVSTDGNKFLGALFFGAVMIMFNGLSKLALTVIKLPGFFKQRELLSLQEIYHFSRIDLRWF